MTGLALAAVLFVARIVVLWGRPVPWTPELLLACFGQDALVASVVLAVETMARRWRWSRRVVPVLFGCTGAYVAVNVAIARVLPTPLTWQMLEAARGPLADSVWYYLTPSMTAAVAIVLATGVAGRRVGTGVTPGRMLMLAAGLGGLGVAGTWTTRHVDTWGMHRNALVALASSLLPAVDVGPVDPGDVPARAGATGPRSPFHGRAAGRHLVVIGLESTGAQYMTAYGSQEDVMPHLEALAANAIVFDNAYAVSPDSIRSLYSVICSRYPAFDMPVEAYADAPCGSVMPRLRVEGYRTALFHSGRFGYLGMDTVIRGRGYEHLEDAGDIGGTRESSFGVEEPATVARILSWIDSLGHAERFAVTYLPVAGHHPYAVSGAGAFGAASERDRYRSALRDGDSSIGVLVDGLKARGVFDETMFVVYGDHGEAFGEHPGNVGHTFFLFEENVRVPLFVALPGALTGQTRRAAITSLVDVAPTIVDLMDLPDDARHQGRSGLGEDAGAAMFFTDYGSRLVGLRDGHWKFIHDLGLGRSYLYNLETDPEEGSNVAPLNANRVTLFLNVLERWGGSQKASLTGHSR